ncbi:DHA2 family efflux MFS transporter permease subunit [Calothrix sp. FACHB-156]|nr:DHA2 family efflux MFS transporter permease subunit [Calothrix sp. FACHB-156]
MSQLPIQSLTLSTSQKSWVLLGVGLGVFMSTLDVGIINVALPTLVQSFHTSFPMAQWAVLSYQLVSSGLVLGATRLGDMWGKKPLYQAGLIIFTLSSLLCSFAPTIEWLIGFRALQGLGSVFISGLGLAIVTEVFPTSERGRAVGIIGSVVSLGIASGPSAGGLLLNLSGWHSIFLINVPLGIIASFLVARLVPPSIPSDRKQKFDPLGALLALWTLGSFGLGMTFGQSEGFSSINTIVLLAIAALSFLTFLVVEAILDQPLLELHLFRNLQLSMSLLSGWLTFTVIGGSLLITPFFLERVKNYPTAKVGLLLAFSPILSGLVAPLAGILADRLGARLISSIGLGLMIGGCLGISTFNAQITEIGYISRYFIYGIGLGLFQSPNNTTAMGAVSRDRLGIASGLLSLSRTCGNTVGVSLIGAVFGGLIASVAAGADVSVAPPEAIVTGFQGTFRFAALILCASAAASVFKLPHEVPQVSLSQKFKNIFSVKKPQKIPAYQLQSLKSFVKLVKNPNDFDAFYELAEGLNHTEIYQASREYIKSHSEVLQTVQERYFEPNINLDELLKYPSDSLAYIYATYLKQTELNSEFDRNVNVQDNNRYISLRLRQNHHIHRIITGFENNLTGEIGLHAFLLAQTRDPLSVAIIAIGLVHNLHSREDLSQIINYIHHGWNMGLKAKPLLAQKWEENWHKSLSNLRTELGVETAISSNYLSSLAK